MKKVLQHSYDIFRNKPINYLEGDFVNCINEFKYSTYTVSFNKYKYSFISVEGSIYNYGIRLVKKSLVGPKHYSDFTIKRRLREIYKYNKIFLDGNGKYLVAFDAWCSGHYHWISEVLPRLILIKSELSEYTLLLPDSEYVKTIGIKLLDVFGLKPKAVIYIKHSELYFASTLFFISQVALTGYINDKIIGKIQRTLNTETSSTMSKSSRKIYISREQATKRKVLNEREVQNYLVSKGFDIVHFENMTIEEQISICKESDTIISIHGAGLTNMVFMPEGSTVIEFRRGNTFINQCYWHLADSLHHKYYYLFGEPDSDKPIEGDGCNLTISIDQLSALLTQALN